VTTAAPLRLIERLIAQQDAVAAGGGWRRAAASMVSFAGVVLAALVLATPVVFVAGSDPVEAYGALLRGSLGGQQSLAESLISMTPLLFAGLAVAMAFQAGLFNIGAEGQLVIGGLMAGYVGADLDLPPALHLLVAVLAGFLGGALWAVIPAVLKAWRGVHEVITTIMMNFVAFSVSQYLVKPGGALVSATQPQATDRVASAAELPRIWDPTRLHAGIFLALVVAGLCWYLLYRTPLGFRFRMVGANPTAAGFNGVATKRVIVQALMLSGGLAGLAGAVEVLGVHRRYFDSFSPGYGFDSIAVALLGALNPIGVAVAAAFFGLLRAGSIRLQSEAGLTRDMVTVISGLVVACVAAQPLIRRVRARSRRSPGGEVAETTSGQEVTRA